VNRLFALASAHKVATAVVIGATVAGAIAVVGPGPTTATVSKIVDGDTIDVTYDGQEHRVRLLNIDTPESVDPNEPVECLGPEATEFLRNLLPVGTEVALRHDQDRYDRYDRELAAVYKDDVLVNAEIARAGLGVAIVVGDNDRFYDEVAAAQKQADDTERGLYSVEEGCTLPGQVAAVEEASETTWTSGPSVTAGVEALEDHAGELAKLVTTATAIVKMLDGDRHRLPLSAFDDYELDRLRTRTESAADRIESAEETNEDYLEHGRERLAREQAEAAEAAERAAEAAAQEAEREAARRQWEEENARRTSAPQAPSSGGSSGTSSNGGGGSDGYTGCRSYAPGGQTYTKIDCTTKQPIG
jgi:micrococcal nuclease